MPARPARDNGVGIILAPELAATEPKNGLPVESDRPVDRLDRGDVEHRLAFDRELEELGDVEDRKPSDDPRPLVSRAPLPARELREEVTCVDNRAGRWSVICPIRATIDHRERE